MTSEIYDKLATIIFGVIPFAVYSLFAISYVKANYQDLKEINFSTYKILKDKKLRSGLIKLFFLFIGLVLTVFVLFFASAFLSGYLKSVGLIY
jgi:hypothetical protein